MRADVIKDTEWTLTIDSFKGFAPGAEHYYGRLERDLYLPGEDERGPFAWTRREEVQVQHPLTADEARRLNRLNEDMGRDYLGQVEAGEWSRQFWTEEDVLAAALVAFAQYANPVREFLVKNHDYDHKRVLAGNADVAGENYVEPWNHSTVMGASAPDDFKDVRHYQGEDDLEVE